MTSEIDVCNRALGLLGEPRIIAYTDGTKGALCEDLYPMARDFVLRAHPWARAKKQASLTQADYDGTGYDYEYLLPTDMLRLLEVVTDNTVPREMREGRIVSDAETMEILYVYRLTDLTKMDENMISAIVAYLAYLLAPHITNNPGIQQQMLQLYKMNLMEGRFLDLEEAKEPDTPEDDWAEVGRS